MNAIVPRPEDFYFAEITTESGETRRWAISALNELAARYEIEWLMSAPPWFQDKAVSGSLYSVTGELVASGDLTSFTEARS